MITLGTIAGAFFLLAGLAIVVSGIKKISVGIDIKRSETVPIGEFVEQSGANEFEGAIEAAPDHDPFFAPFSGEEALLSTYEVERRERKRRSNGNGSRTTWRTEASGELTQPVVVRDETGSVALDPDGATVDPDEEPQQHRTGGSLPDNVRLRLSVLADRLDLEVLLAQDKSKLRRYSEGVIPPGEAVHVYGAERAEQTAPENDIDARVTGADGYRITQGTEADAVRRMLRRGVGTILAGGLFAGVGLLAIASEFGVI